MIRTHHTVPNATNWFYLFYYVSWIDYVISPRWVVSYLHYISISLWSTRLAGLEWLQNDAVTVLREQPHSSWRGRRYSLFLLTQTALCFACSGLLYSHDRRKNGIASFPSSSVMTQSSLCASRLPPCSYGGVPSMSVARCKQGGACGQLQAEIEFKGTCNQCP